MANQHSTQLLAAERCMILQHRQNSHWRQLWIALPLPTLGKTKEREASIEFSLPFLERGRVYFMTCELAVSQSQAMPRWVDALLSCSGPVTYLGQLGFPAVLSRPFTNASSIIPPAPKVSLGMGAH